MHLTLPQKPGLMFSWVRNSSLQILTLCPKRFSVCVFTYSQSWKISACRICSTIYMIRSSIKSRPKKKQGGAGALPRLCVIQFYLGYLFHSAFQFRILFWESASLLFFLVTIHSWYGLFANVSFPLHFNSDRKPEWRLWLLISCSHCVWHKKIKKILVA